jgi:MYXO-CTERM domain-containing protein
LEDFMKLRPWLVAFSFVAPVAVLAPRVAHAGLDACGNIDVKANAQCQVVASGGCTAQCEPLKVQAACSAKLQAQCNGQCTATADVSCTGSCTADCSGKCTANPGSFDCQGSCTGSCDADCDAQCSGSASGGSASGSCKANCQANCSAKCDAQCTGTPPSATCDAKCQASCNGSCQAKASAQCQIDCQGKLEADCEATVTGGCKAQCQDPKGALFCDGQYVDTGNNLQNCVDALNAILNVKVSGSASADCNGGTCNAQAEGTASACSTSGPGTNANTPLGVLALGALGVVVARLRRRSA